MSGNPVTALHLVSKSVWLCPSAVAIATCTTCDGEMLVPLENESQVTPPELSLSRKMSVGERPLTLQASLGSAQRRATGCR